MPGRSAASLVAGVNKSERRGKHVTTVELEKLDEGEATSQVTRWRLAALERAGYDEQAARELAVSTSVDLHRAVDLVRAGCPPDLAYRILR